MFCYYCCNLSVSFSALNSIDMIFKKLGHHLDSFLPHITQIVWTQLIWSSRS